MKLLFDTHTFIWWDSEPTKLSPKALGLLSDKYNVKLLSVASIWEIQIKHQLGKLSFKIPLEDIVNEQIDKHNISILPITYAHVLGLDNLPLYHKDPFDRLLISQANTESAILISRDSIFTRYRIASDW